MKMTCQVKMHAGTATLDTFFEQIFLLNQMNISSTLQQKYGNMVFRSSHLNLGGFFLEPSLKATSCVCWGFCYGREVHDPIMDLLEQ